MLINYTPKNKNYSHLFPFLVILFCISIINQVEIKAQSNCPIQSNQTVGWVRSPSGATPIKYFLQGSFNGQQSQVTSAFTKWNQAMAATCLKVNFVPGAEDDYDLLVTSSNEEATSGGLNSTYPIPGTSGAININPDDFDSSLPGYSTIFHKAALHEIGHTLGLDHPFTSQQQPAVAGGTVRMLE